MDRSPPGSSFHGIFPARILEWVSTSSSKGSSWPRISLLPLLCWPANSLPLSHLGSLQDPAHCSGTEMYFWTIRHWEQLWSISTFTFLLTVEQILSVTLNQLHNQNIWSWYPNTWSWNQTWPCGAPGHNSLSVSSISLITGNRLLSASKIFLEYQEAGSKSC